MVAIIEYINHIVHRASIGQKIIFICLILVIIPTLVLGIVAYTTAYDTVYNNIQENLQIQVSDMQDASATTFELTQNNLKGSMGVFHDQFYSKGTPALINGKMTLNSGSNQYVVNDNFEMVDHIQNLIGVPATVFQKQGDQAIRVSTNILTDEGTRAVGTPVSQQVYERVVINGQTYYGTADILGKQYVTVYEPIKDDNGDIIGILFIGEDQKETIGVLENQIRSKKIGENGYMYILSGSGTALIHPTREGKTDTDLPFIVDIITQKNGFIKYSFNGDEKIAAFTYYEPLDWIIVATGSLSDFTGPIDTIRNAIIIVIILGIAGGTLVSFWFGRSISRRMDELVGLAGRITAGNFSGTRVESVDNDEIGVLSRAFGEVVRTVEAFRDEIQLVSEAAAVGRLDIRGNSQKFHGDYSTIIQGVNATVDAMTSPIAEAMRLSDEYARGNFTARVNDEQTFSGDFISFKEALNKIGADVSGALIEIKEQMQGLSAGVHTITVSVDGVVSGIHLAGRSIHDVSAGTGQVAQIAGSVNTLADRSGQTTDQILVAMQDLSTTVSSVAAKIEGVSILTQEAATLSSRGKDVAIEAEGGMKGILKSSGEIERLVLDISNQMNEIGRIVGIIGGIAEQTNLLALNAAIEAARAGEAGLGFAVVAGEVKELASGSQKSAENIAQIIGRLQKQTQIITETVKTSLSDVKTGSESVEETLSIFNTFVSSISDINQHMNEVAAASEEQAASVEEVTATVHEYGTMVTQTATEAVGLAAASEESSAAVAQIVEMIREVTNSMDQIRSAVSNAGEAFERVNTEMDRFKI
jgi:methyl-accepting chemotaxis protein